MASAWELRHNSVVKIGQGPALKSNDDPRTRDAVARSILENGPSTAAGSVCLECRPSACATPQLETLELMAALLSSDWESANKSEGKNRREASGLIAAYLQWHLERGLRSLPIVERV